MKTLIVLLTFVSLTTFAADKKGPDLSALAKATAKQEPTKAAATPAATITKADAIKAIETASATPSPSPTPGSVSIVPFGSALQDGTKIYLTSYASADGKELISIKLDCSVETNLKSVKASYGYTVFNQYVKTHCPKAILPGAIQ